MKVKTLVSFFYLCVVCLAGTSAAAGNFVYIKNVNGTIEVLDADNNHMPIAGSPFGTPGMGGPSVSVAVSPNGARCYGTGWQNSDTVSIFDIDSSSGALTQIAGSPFATAMGSAPFMLAVTPDSSRIYVTFSGTNEIAQYDASFNLIGMPLSTGMNAPHGIAMHPDGQSIYVVYTNNGLVEKFDANLNSLAGPIATGMAPYAVIVNSSGTRVYVSNAGSSDVIMFDQNLVPITSSGASLSAPIGMAINEEETILYVANTGSSDVAVLDANTLAPLQPNLSSQGNNSYVAALNPEGALLYITNGGAPPTPLSVRDVNNGYAPIAGSPFASAFQQYFIAFTPGVFSFPGNFRGKQKKNDFGVCFELYNALQWDPVVGSAGYFVYRNGHRIATLSASTLHYDDHNRPPKVATLYAVSSFDANGNESSAATIIIN